MDSSPAEGGESDDADAEFAGFVRSRSAALHRTAYLMTGNSDAAQDVVQTALTRIYLAWPRRAFWENRDAYARKVVTNVVLSEGARRWRGEQPTGELPEPPADGRSDDVTLLAERDALRRALMALPVRQRTAVVLRHYVDLSEADTAATMDCPLNTVKSLTARGLAALRTHVEGARS
ncbi:MAG: SigE family RNA polymerase sigma factor [Mycobacteriales bacterium]|nr:MAG: SigE family RNA polymerase sigma factor [Pseudonocardiales bacterium]